MRNHTFLLFLTAMLLSGSTMKAQITNDLTAENNSKPEWTESIVKIWYECGGKIYTGAGIIVSKSGYILTAEHVGNICGTNSTTVIKVGFVDNFYDIPKQSLTAIEVNSLTDNPDNATSYDLKLLKVNNLNGRLIKPIELSKSLPMPGDNIFIAGFPDLPFIFLQNQKLSSLSVFKTNILSCYDEAKNGIPTRIHYGGNSLPGFSGGPIFNDENELIGLHSSRTTANISNLLNTICEDSSNNNCWGNAVKFDVMSADNTVRTQTININYIALKNLLDNYSWGTSIWRIPQGWIDMIRK